MQISKPCTHVLITSGEKLLQLQYLTLLQNFLIGKQVRKVLLQSFKSAIKYHSTYISIPTPNCEITDDVIEHEDQLTFGLDIFVNWKSKLIATIEKM